MAGVSGNARLGDERKGPIRGDLWLEGKNDVARKAAHRFEGRHVRERPEDPSFVDVGADGVVCKREVLIDTGAVESKDGDLLAPTPSLKPSAAHLFDYVGVDLVPVVSGRKLRERRAADLPAREHGPHCRASHDAAVYSVDGEKAFRFLPDQRAEWWMQCFVWLLAPGQVAPKPSAGVWAARRAGQPERRFGFLIDTRGDFGGGHNPSRYQRVANLKTAVARARHKEFDDAHPLPPCAAVVRGKRQALVAAGLLPAEPGQVEPRDMQAYLDDDAGSALNDITGVPPELAHVALDFSAMLPHRGAPSRLDSRVANHCRIVIVTNLDFGFFVSPKTQCGDPVLSLGLLVGVRLDRLSIPGYKIGVIVDQALALRDQASRLSTVMRDEIEQCIGRLVHVSQVALDIFPSLHPGYRAAASHRAVVTLDVGLRQELIGMLDEAVRLLQTDPGLPLIHACRVPSTGDPSMLVVHTDASRANVDDGFGGWAFNPSDAGQLFVCAVAWPNWLRPAMAASAARERDRSSASSGRFSMPAAELFGALAVGAAIRAALPPGLVTVVLGVTDCKPACYAVQGSRSSSAAMRPLLQAMRADDGTRWLSIWVPRDENSDADVASHPSLRNSLVAAARALGLRVSLLTESDILHEHWALAARAASIPWP